MLSSYASGTFEVITASDKQPSDPTQHGTLIEFGLFCWPELAPIRSITPLINLLSWYHRPAAKSAFYDSAIERYENSSPNHALPTPSCGGEHAGVVENGCGSAPERLLDKECDAAARAAAQPASPSPFAADSLASACSHISLQSSSSADELQVCVGVGTICFCCNWETLSNLSFYVRIGSFAA